MSVRVRLVAVDNQYAVEDVPIAIPITTGVKGLSKVVNHLLNRDTPIRFFFEEVNSGNIVEQALEKFIEQNDISTEDELTLKFFTVLSKPESNSDSVETEEWLSCIAITNSSVIVGSFSGCIEIYLSKDLKVKKLETRVHNKAIKSLCVVDLPSNDFTLLLTGSITSEVCLTVYSEKKKKLLKYATLRSHLSCVISLAARITTEREIHIASGAWDRNIIIHKLPEFEFQEQAFVLLNEDKRKPDAELSAFRILSEHKDKVSCLAYLRIKLANEDIESDNLISGSYDHTLKIFNSEYTCILKINCVKVPLSISFCKASTTLYTSHVDGCLRSWSINTKSEKFLIKTYRSRESQTFLSCCTVVNDYIYAGSYQGNILCWHKSLSSPVHILKNTQEGKVFDIGADTPESAIFTVGSDTYIRKHQLKH